MSDEVLRRFRALRPKQVLFTEPDEKGQMPPHAERSRSLRIIFCFSGNADVGEDVDGSDFLYCSLFHGSSWHPATGAENLRAGHINGLSVPLVAIGEIHLLRAP